MKEVLAQHSTVWLLLLGCLQLHPHTHRLLSTDISERRQDTQNMAKGKSNASQPVSAKSISSVGACTHPEQRDDDPIGNTGAAPQIAKSGFLERNEQAGL